jgi:transposase
MAIARMPEAFFDLAEHHLPPERYVGPAGGRPPIDNRSIAKTLWFVLATGCRWEDVPPELGCSGRSAHRFLQLWEEMGCWDRLHADLLRQLRKAGKLDPDLVIVDAVILRAFGGGESTGPSPVDRGRKGIVRRPWLRQRPHPLATAVAGDRAAHRPEEDGARQRAGEDPLGGGADHQLAQGATADAGPLRPPGCHPGRLDYPGCVRHLLPLVA